MICLVDDVHPNHLIMSPYNWGACEGSVLPYNVLYDNVTHCNLVKNRVQHLAIYTHVVFNSIFQDSERFSRFVDNHGLISLTS